MSQMPYGSPPPPPLSPQPPGDGRQSNRTALIAVTVLIVVGGVVGFVALLNGDDEAPQDESSPQADATSLDETQVSSATSPSPESPPGTEVSPEDTVRAFFAAASVGDCGTVVDLMTEESWNLLSTEFETTGALPTSTDRQEAVDGCRTSVEQDPIGTLDGTEMRFQEGNQAAVDVTSTTDGETRTQEYLLVQEADSWKIDFIALYERGS